MDTLQSWLIVGIPGAVVIAALFAGRSPVRAAIGYVALAGLLVFFVTVPGDPISGIAVGVLGVLLLASGRGGAVEHEPNHHIGRKRFTTDPSAG